MDDNMVVRLTDQETSELFAECPLPSDGTPLTTAVEPVIDSSRYFVLRIVDKETGKHAFVGLGFRERTDASGFTAGLDEYRKYLKRKAEADKMKAEYEQQQSGEGGPTRDYSLKENISLPLKIGSTKQQTGDGASSSAEGRTESKATAEASAQGIAALKLAPPPPPPPQSRGSPVAAAAAPAAAGSGASGGGAGIPRADADAEEWGDFTGTA